ncbi:7TM diverse intracellular signaling domain-containing protein [Oligoflexus tunisiensis]|uniref:7TM diverse intracellular signaling domain-containing protein n=1 Tax=Oligoflexus tunisiensis TaxID=708132 RepID=UPI00114CDFAC|nr:7TM diverse intracellular signaling domain-containing protein [Oligoflexus tunisiensis]
MDYSRGHKLLPDWEVYWQQFLSPEELQAGKGLMTGVLNQSAFQSLEGVMFQGTVHKTGYATFRTRVILPPSPEPLVLTFNKIKPPARVWVDGKLMVEHGRVGTEPEAVKEIYRPLRFDLQPRPEGNEIVLQIANFHTAFMGPHRPIMVSSRKAQSIKERSSLIMDFFLIGAAIVMSFYHFALYLIRPSEPAARNFACFCLIVAIRFSMMSEGFLMVWAETMGPMNGLWANRLEMWGFSLGVIFFYLFLSNLFPKEVPKFLSLIVISASTIYTLMILFFSAVVHQHVLRPYQLIVVTAGCFVLFYSLTLAVKRRREGSRIFVLGFVTLFAALINDILLTNQIINSVDMFPLGVFGYIFFQSVILSKRFAKAFEQVSIAEKEIRTLNDDLELKVIERTQTIRTILDNVRSGFLMIDCEFRVQEGFTRSCWEILGPQVAPRVLFADLFDLSPRERSLLELSLKQAFDDMLPEDVALAQIPNRYTLGRKVVALQGSLVRNSLGKPEALLISISDASQLVKAEQESSKNKSLLKIISERSSFRAFLKDSLDSLNACLGMIEQQNQREVAMVLHTLKGNFALYGLDPIASFIHEIEEKKVLTKLDIRAIVQTVDEFIQLNGQILGLNAGLAQDAYEVPAESLHKLEHDLQKASINRSAMQVIQTWMREVRMVPVRELLGPIDANVARVADALGKRVHFEMRGADLKVDPDRMRHPLKNLIHAVINSIDHGIEYPEERGEKDSAGHVLLSFNYDEMAYLRVEVSDDGRGLDVELIRTRALEKGLVTQEQLDTMSEEDVQTLIFRQGFSTKNDVSG